MKHAKAPEGHYTEVVVAVTLGNGSVQDFAWDTEMALSPALHKAPKWAKRSMTEEKTPGRSDVRGITVGVVYVKGTYGKTREA